MVTTRSYSRSTRVIVPSKVFATHVDPPPTTTAPGPRPTAYCFVIRPPSGSIMPTAFSSMPGSPSGCNMRLIPKAAAPARSRTAAAAISTAGRRYGGGLAGGGPA
jgi:hypothetical protein